MKTNNRRDRFKTCPYEKGDKMRSLTTIIFLTAMVILHADCETKKPKPLPNPGALTDKEKEAIEHQKKIMDEILALYAERALYRPADFTICVREMFAMRRSKKCRDKFTHYSSPKEAARISQNLAGRFIGAGIEIAQDGDKVVVIGLVPGTPAERAGILPRDVILKIDGQEPADVNEAAVFIRGKIGTKVAITVFRERLKKEFNFTLTREIVVIQSVMGRRFVGDKKIGIVQIGGFEFETPQKFEKVMVELAEAGAESFVFDLRGNPGGLVRSVLSLLGVFSRDNDRILTMRYRRFNIVFNSRTISPAARVLSLTIAEVLGVKSPRDINVVVLINGRSASASEIFAGTMKDWGYPIVGEKSFGKGTGQDIITLSDGSRLALTTFEFLVGNGKAAVRDKGVLPTVEVKPAERKPAEKEGYESDSDNDDLQLMKAIEILQSCNAGNPGVHKCARH